MINLLPPEGHKALKREYVLRMCAALGFLFGWIFIFLTASLVPTYVLVEAQIHTSQLEFEQEQDEEASFKKVQEEVKETEKVLAQIKKTESGLLRSEIIEEIEKQTPQNISFSTFTIAETSEGAVEKIEIQGTAPTREALAKLRVALEASELFLKAEVPIADLARDVDLPFTLTLILAENV